MKTTNPFLELLNQVPATTTGTTATPTAPPAPPPNPFAGLVESMPQSGWGNPNAMAWMQQALSNPYMQGWGGAPIAPAPAPGTGTPAPGTGTGTPAPGTGGTPGPIPLTGAPAEQIGGQFLDRANELDKKRNQAAVMGFLGALAGGNPVTGALAMGGQAIANTIKGNSLYDSGYGYQDIRPYMLQQGFTTQQPKGKASTLYYWTDPKTGKKVPVNKHNKAAWNAWHAAFANSVAALDAMKAQRKG